MGRRSLAVAACAATGSLVLAASAFAKTPQLLVSGAIATGASAATVIQVSEDKTAAAPHMISIYLPPRYVANLGQSPGTQIGTVTAGVQALQVSDAVIPNVSGTVVTDAPSKYATNTCAPGMHAAVWLLQLTVQGAIYDVPAYVDRASGDETLFSAVKVVLCFANPYDEAVSGTRAPFGVKLVDAKVTLSAGMFTNPTSAGSYVWRTVIAPWTANGATANPAGTIETQSIVNIPSSLSLKAKVRTTRHRKHGRTAVANSVLLSGKLLENLKGVAGATVVFFANGKTAGSAPTATSGAFARKTGLARTTTLKATATVPTRETGCVNPLPATFAPAGCVAATIAGYKLASNTVTVAPKKR